MGGLRGETKLGRQGGIPVSETPAVPDMRTERLLIHAREAVRCLSLEVYAAGTMPHWGMGCLANLRDAVAAFDEPAPLSGDGRQE